MADQSQIPRGHPSQIPRRESQKTSDLNRNHTVSKLAALEPVRLISPERSEMDSKPKMMEVETSAPEKEEILEGPFFQVVETPYFDKNRGKKQTVTFSVDPNLSPKSKSLDYYWLDVPKKASLKLFQKELLKIHKNKLDDTPIEVIHLNNVIEDIQTTLVSINFQRDLHVSQNLKETEAEAFQAYYEQNAKHYRKQADLKESEREAQHNRQQALEAARKMQSHINHC